MKMIATSTSRDHLMQTRNDPPLIRRYRTWRGANTFCCRGKCMTGSSPGGLAWSNVMIIVPYVLYGVFVVPKMHILLFVGSCVLFLMCFISLWQAALTDPGILRRNLSEDVPPKPAQAVEDEDLVSRGVIHPSSAVKYCTTCNIWRPKRARHCRFCDTCVLEFDHHCPWTGNCVGRRNYRYFFRFIISTLVLAIYICALCVYELVHASQNDYPDGKGGASHFGSAMVDNIMATIIGSYCFFIIVSLLGLNCYHCGLVITGQTTNEQLRGNYRAQSGYTNPFDRGCAENCYRVCFSERPPSELSDMSEFVVAVDTLDFTHQIDDLGV